MKLSKLIVLIALSSVIISCKKENPSLNSKKQSIITVNPVTSTVPTYQFTQAQLILSTTLTQPNGNLHIYSVSKHHITDYNWSTGYLVLYNTSDLSYNYYTTTLIEPQIYTQSLGTTTLDQSEHFFYAAYGGILYKYDIVNGGVVKVTTGLGKTHAMRALPNGSIALTSDSLSGSLVVVTTSGIKTAIAKNLGNAGSFDLFNGQYYVVNNNVIDGSVLQVSASGAVTTILNNLTEPSKIAVDTNGNLIVDEEVTIDGQIYQSYFMYTPAGVSIGTVNDNTGAPIIGARYAYPNTGQLLPGNAELYVDSFDNLFFLHEDDGSGNCYPKSRIASTSIWKAGMVMQ